MFQKFLVKLTHFSLFEIKNKWLLCEEEQDPGRKRKLFFPILAKNSLCFNILCVSCLQEFDLALSGIAININIGLQLNDKKGWRLHKMFDWSIIFYFLSNCIYFIKYTLSEYCSIPQNKHLDNSNLNFVVQVSPSLIFYK